MEAIDWSLWRSHSRQSKCTEDPATSQRSRIRSTLDGTVYDFDFAFDGQGRLDVLSYPDIAGYRFKVDYDSAGALSVAKDGDRARKDTEA